MKSISTIVALLVSLLSGCAHHHQASFPYYELTTSNAGKKDLAGVDIFFDDQAEGVGGLGPNREYSKTHGFFEAKVPYPTRIEYDIDFTGSQRRRLEVTNIKIIGEWKPNTANQSLLVEIDSTNQTAIARVVITP